MTSKMPRKRGHAFPANNYQFGWEDAIAEAVRLVTLELERK